MKYLITIIINFLIMSTIAQYSDLEITITNIKEIEGHIQIGLYNDPELFPEVNKQFKVFYFKVNSNTMKYTIKGLKNDDYALAIFHDLNSDTICNRNFMGIPTEDYGFSNNVRPFLSPPSFENAKINLNKINLVKIKLD